MDAVEVPNALGELTESGGPIDVAKRLYRPQVDRWAVRMIKAGGLRHFTVPGAQAFPQEGPLNLPGRPVPVATPGPHLRAHQLVPAVQRDVDHWRRTGHRPSNVQRCRTSLAAGLLLA